jgi:hypothetical protein
MNHSTKQLTLALGALGLVSTAQASTDWGPADWHAICNANWYTSGNGHSFCVIHDMEGYYASVIAWFDNCSMSSASIHYAVNGKQDATSDYPAGDVTQLGVREAYYAWHACCWNTYMFGTEHEGFASNPAWFTKVMYANSATLQRHLCDGFSITKNRNHIIGHREHLNANWRSWASANYAFDPNCNSHTDPGTYWDWSTFMGYITGTETSKQDSKSPADGTVINAGANFTFSLTVTNNGDTPWICLGGNNGYTLNFRSGTQMGAASIKNLGTDNVYPGEKHTFTYTLTAPSSSGTYTAYFRMNNTDANYFGNTYHCTINVGGSLITDIVDNDDADFSASSNWATGTSATDKYGSDYRTHSTVSSSDTADWTPNLAAGGSFKIYAWWAQGSSRSTAAPYIVYHSTGSTTVKMNQTANGGKWNLLGTFNLNAGVNTVSLSCWAATGDNVCADAIKWVQQ